MRASEVANLLKPYIMQWITDSWTGTIARIDTTSGGVTSGRRQFVYHVPSSFSAGTGGLRIYNRFGSALTIAEVHISVSAAVSGSDVIVDVHKNGTTIFTTQANRPTISVGSQTGVSSSINVTNFANGQYLTVDIDQGSGSDLSVVVLVA